MPALWIAHVTVTDEEAYGKYAALAGPAIAKHGGHFIARGGPALARLADFRINCFGHVGDGNLHYNVFPAPGKTRADYEHLRGEVKRVVHDLVDEMGGSVSAEHGIGRLKVEDLERYGDPAKLAAMRAIKAALDPAGIMNPGAVLRAA